jgi:multidrug efflux system membrane fusion protein
MVSVAGHLCLTENWEPLIEVSVDEQVGRHDLAPREIPPVARPKLPPRAAARGGLRGWIIGAVVLLVAVGLVLWWHPWGGGGRGRPGEPSSAVRTATAVVGTMPLVDNELGTVTPLATVTVKTQINGVLQQVAFQEGQEVKKGDFLAQIDPRPYQVALAQAQGQLAKDQGLLAQAQADLKRYQTLNRQDSISHQQVDDQVFLVQQDQGAVAADQASVASAQLNLAYCHIVSPVDGRIGLRQVDPGNYVQTSDANGLVIITQMQPMSVIFTIPEDDLPQVIKRIKAGATLPVTVFDRSDVTQLASGQVATYDNQVDTTTGTVKIRANFPNADEALFPSQFVNAHLLVDTLQGVTLVPTAAVQRGAPGTYVYVVGAGDAVSVRPVKIGAADATNTVITSGLKPGEQAVIDGADRLRDGAHVIVNNATPGVVTPPPARPAGERPAGERPPGERRRRPQQSD